MLMSSLMHPSKGTTPCCVVNYIDMLYQTVIGTVYNRVDLESLMIFRGVASHDDFGVEGLGS